VSCDIQIQRLSGLWYSAEYSTFSISDEAGKYRLSVMSGHSGDLFDALGSRHTSQSQHNSNGQMFTTPDSDNDRRDDCETKLSYSIKSIQMFTTPDSDNVNRKCYKTK